MTKMHNTPEANIDLDYFQSLNYALDKEIQNIKYNINKGIKPENFVPYMELTPIESLHIYYYECQEFKKSYALHATLSAAEKGILKSFEKNLTYLSEFNREMNGSKGSEANYSSLTKLLKKNSKEIAKTISQAAGDDILLDPSSHKKTLNNLYRGMIYNLPLELTYKAAKISEELVKLDNELMSYSFDAESTNTQKNTTNLNEKESFASKFKSYLTHFCEAILALFKRKDEIKNEDLISAFKDAKKLSLKKSIFSERPVPEEVSVKTRKIYGKFSEKLSHATHNIEKGK
ncbi:MAG: hypothetical protein K0Q51_1228 [Rickettsiaceae bacterium]|jgi:hypothetical protein|nr:hypothetical protein [Rickettsiaceae bacterium]